LSDTFIVKNGLIKGDGFRLRFLALLQNAICH